MSQEQRGFDVYEMDISTIEIPDQSALLAQDDAIFEEQRAARPLDVEFRGPCPADVVGQRMVWLGFRIAPSEWPGYLRLGFACDLDFNIATLDIHHTQFQRLQDGIERVLKGQSAGIQLTTPGELHSRQVRRQAGAMLLDLKEGASDIHVLDIGHKTLLKARLYTPDLMIALSRILPALSEINPAPDRRSLRTARTFEPALVEDMPPEMQVKARQEAQIPLPEYWINPKDKPEILDLVTLNLRNDERFHDLVVDLRSVHLSTKFGLFPLDRMSFDFGEFPVQMALDYRPDPKGKPKTLVTNFVSDDFKILRDTVKDDFWVVRLGNGFRVDVPFESRPMIIETLRAPMALYKETHNKMNRLQTSLYFGRNFVVPKDKTFEVLDQKAQDRRLKKLAKSVETTGVKAEPDKPIRDAIQPTHLRHDLNRPVIETIPFESGDRNAVPTESDSTIPDASSPEVRHLRALAPDLR